MMKINLNNYEAFFLDYTEGNLTRSQEKELNKFLEEYPDLKLELEEFTIVNLDVEEVESVDLKNALRREESTHLPMADYLMIAEVEGTITVEEKAYLSDLVRQSPGLMNDLALYHKVKLGEETTLSFPAKSALLQKESKGIVWWRYSAAVAAAILFLFFWNGNSEEYYSPRLTSYSATIQSSADLKNSFAFIVEKVEEHSQALEKAPKASTVKTSLAAVTKEKRKLQKELPAIQNRKEKEQQSPQLANKESKEKAVGKKDLPNIEGDDYGQLADASVPPNGLTTDTDDFVPIKEFAKERIKTDLLKGKTFSETVMDELEEASNEKVSFKREKDQEGATQKFAINIGKFSFSRNK